MCHETHSNIQDNNVKQCEEGRALTLNDLFDSLKLYTDPPCCILNENSQTNLTDAPNMNNIYSFSVIDHIADRTDGRTDCHDNQVSINQQPVNRK
jgi:hypothetical protein